MLKFQWHVELHAVVVEPILGHEFCNGIGGDQDRWEMGGGAVVDEAFECFDSGAAESGTAKNDAVGWHLFVWFEIFKSLEAASWVGGDQNPVTDFFQPVTQ